MEVGRQIAESGARNCRLLPLFMAKGNHFHEDIPAQMAQLRVAYPELQTELLQPIGQHPLFFELMRSVIHRLTQMNADSE
jgi:sirohydrochlorin cobaltochelatase